MFRDRVAIVNNLNHDYIIGTVRQRSYHVATGFSITGRHFLSVNGKMVVQSISTPTIEPIIKNKSKIKLSPHSITVVSVKTPPNINKSQIYEISYKFPLPSGVVPIYVVHKFDKKVPYELMIPILNTNNNIANITKNMTIVSLRPAEKVDSIFSLYSRLWDFVDQEIKQLEDVDIISCLISNWASPNLVVSKKPNLNVSSTKDNKQFNLRLCIDYCKLNNRILTARQIKADGRLGKVVANCQLPTIDYLLTHFKD